MQKALVLKKNQVLPCSFCGIIGNPSLHAFYLKQRSWLEIEVNMDFPNNSCLRFHAYLTDVPW